MSGKISYRLHSSDIENIKKDGSNFYCKVANTFANLYLLAPCANSIFWLLISTLSISKPQICILLSFIVQLYHFIANESFFFFAFSILITSSVCIWILVCNCCSLQMYFEAYTVYSIIISKLCPMPH